MSEPTSRCPFHRTDHISEFDALDPATRADPLPFYDWLRSETKSHVYKLPREENFYIVHRYDEVKNIFSDSINYSSKIIPTSSAAFPALADGKDHIRIREVMLELFHQKNLADFEDEIKEYIRNATSDLSNGHSTELFENWANVIPLASLSILFGMDTSREALHKLHNDSIAINRALFVTGGTGPRRSLDPSLKEKIKIAGALFLNLPKVLKLVRYCGWKGFKELLAMLRITDKNLPLPRPSFEHIPAAISPLLDLMNVFAKEISNPKNHNSSIQILKNNIAKSNVSKMEVIMTGAFIFFAGYETTSSLLSNCIVHLCRHPDLFQKLKADPGKLEGFIEESLRYYTPVGRFLRRANRDMEIDGTPIPKNSILILMTGAANTDPEKFSNGCAFDMDRNNNRQHLSFGKGVHFCAGAPLARMQVTFALQELIANARTIELVQPEQMKMVTDRDNGILRYESIFVKVNPETKIM